MEKDTPARPAGLPAEARFAPIEEWFEVVETKDGHRFGPMRAFRSDDGTLLVEARFDAEGRLQGTYKRFHRDGVVAREGTYASGAPEGRFVLRRGKDEAFPTSDPRVTEVHVTYAKGKETKRRYLDAEGREVTPGESSDAGKGALDALFRDLEPADVFKSGAFAEVVGMAVEQANEERATKKKSDGFFLWTERAPRARVTRESFRAFYGDP